MPNLAETRQIVGLWAKNDRNCKPFEKGFGTWKGVKGMVALSKIGVLRDAGRGRNQGGGAV